jgi:coenzyme F420 hydrogenase subunit beta
MRKLSNINDIVGWRLCLGCGACAYICPEQKIELVNDITAGMRPVASAAQCASCSLCLEVCPAYENDHRSLNSQSGLINELKSFCGPVLDVWEGHAVDSEIRLAGSSGGLLTALSLYCLNELNMGGVLHIGQNLEDPTSNRTQLSRSRKDLLGKTGSRYAPASACDSLHLIENAGAPCVFIGQPSEVTALRKAALLKPSLAKKVGLTLSFFCAGSPSRKGTLDLLASKGIDQSNVEEIRYRGNGWPGMFAVKLKGRAQPLELMTYHQSWSFVQAYRPFSTHLCPDGSGEDADISCGDPWYRAVQPDDPGSSIIAVRTELGRRIIQGAIESGYVSLKPAEPWQLVESQRNLFEKRGAIWGRLTVLRLLGLPIPRLKGFFLFKNWRKLPWNAKLKSTFGTLRRVMTRKYYRPARLHQASVESKSSKVGSEKIAS